MTKPLITVGICGGTGSGKTTLANKLFEMLGGDEIVSFLVHDNYYKDLGNLSLDERAKTNFDHPDSLDTDYLVQQIRELKKGNEIKVPMYDFAVHSRKSETVTMNAGKIILVEGILILSNPDLVKELDVKVFVDADADIRLARRITRDSEERNRTVQSILSQYFETVRPMHDQWVEPCKKDADIIVHSVGNSLDTTIQVVANHVGGGALHCSVWELNMCLRSLAKKRKKARAGTRRNIGANG